MAIILPSATAGFAWRGLYIGLPLAALVMCLSVVPAALSIGVPISGPASDPTANPVTQHLRADLKGIAASDDVRLVADWIMRNNRHQGRPFIVADKPESLLFAFDANGALLAKAPALFGAARSDVLTEEQANKTLEETERADMVTPAGIFPSEAYSSPRYGESVRFAGYKHTNLLIHRAPGEMRRNLLQALTAGHSRVTLGCINTLSEFMDNVLMPNFSGKSTVVILPETQPAKLFFAIDDAPEPAPQAGKMTSS